MKARQPHRVELLRRTRLADDFFRLDAVEYRVERYDGTLGPPTRRLVLERGDSAAALLVCRVDKRVWLIEQFRIATQASGPGWLLELAAGMVAEGETPEACIRREVLEETGFDIERLEPIGDFYLSPGGASERVHLYVAEVGARRHAGGGVAAEGEDIRLVEFSRDELRAQWRAGGLHDAKTLIAVMHFLGVRP
jgi:ADP-ribose pyrophosphatase